MEIVGHFIIQPCAFLAYTASMKNIMRIPILTITLFTGTLTSAQDPFTPISGRIVTAIQTSNLAAIDKEFDERMRQAFPPEKVTLFFEQLSAQAGKFTRAGRVRIIPPNQSITPLYFERTTFDMKLVLNAESKVAGFWILPHTPVAPAPDKNSTALRLPFNGEWKVIWGGDTPALNQHHSVPNQRYAFDLVVVDAAGHSSRHKGLKNEDYWAFGRKVLAPAAGTVTEVIQGIRDNTPGSMNPYSALGNAVLIQHTTNEISVLAHFKFGSITVAAGDRVKKGQVIGQCGNSGNSSEPHIHYHLQHSPTIQDGLGIRCEFEQVTVTQERPSTAKGRYSPMKGDVIAPTQ